VGSTGADRPYWRSNVDLAAWSVRRLYALWVPGALNLNPNAARSKSSAFSIAVSTIFKAKFLRMPDTVTKMRAAADKQSF
jgi:hypothetical protein